MTHFAVTVFYSYIPALLYTSHVEKIFYNGKHWRRRRHLLCTPSQKEELQKVLVGVL